MAKKTQGTALDTHNKVTAAELENILRLQVTSLLNDPSIASTLPPLLIHGSPGCGKSTIVREICEEFGIGFKDVRLAQMEPCDIRGLPVPNKEKQTMEWYVNGSWPTKEDNPKGGILFLDEITSADKSVAVASYELVLDRRLGTLYKVPDNWYIVAAGNLVTDSAVATTMSSALANRFLHVELKEDQESWLTWARQHDIHPSVIGFIQYKPQMLFDMDDQNLERGWPSPRSWQRVSQMCQICKDENVLRKLIYGLVGNRAGVEFMSFHKLNRKFDDILQTMLDPNSVIKIPEAADERYAMCAAMVYLLWRGKDEEDEKKRMTGFYRICIEMTSDFACMALMAAFEGNDKTKKGIFCDKLTNHPLFVKWRAKHKAAMTAHMKKPKIGLDED